jgi:hypothetical protein
MDAFIWYQMNQRKVLNTRTTCIHDKQKARYAPKDPVCYHKHDLKM